MKTYLFWTSIGILLGGLLGSCSAWAQTSAPGTLQPSIGTPTAAPPGGANTGTIGAPRPAGRAGTSFPAGTAGTTRPAGTAGTTSPAGTAGTSRPAARLRTDPTINIFGRQVFGGNPAMLDVGPSTGETVVRSPASLPPGRPNFNRGSTSASFRPAGPIAGGPNTPENARAFATGDAAAAAPLAGNRALTESAAAGIWAAINAPVIGQSPVIGQALPLDSATPVAPDFEFVPPNDPLRIVLPLTANADVARTPTPGVEGAEAQAAADNDEVAVATAFPAPDASSATTPTQPTVTAPTNRAADAVEVPTGGATPFTANFRGPISSAAERPAQAAVYPGYTIWQGYYWYHSPISGWHYWNGARWTPFAARR